MQQRHKLDRYDLKILQLLGKDGRITKSQLAEAVSLSISPTWERVRKLEQSGLIKGYRAVIDWGALFKTAQVLVEITLAHHTAHDMQRIEKRLEAAPEVVHCYATGGGVDYIVLIQAEDIDHYQRFIDQLLTEDLGIDRYFTYIVTKTIKAGEPQPLRMESGH